MLFPPSPHLTLKVGRGVFREAPQMASNAMNNSLRH